jgi:thiamine-monophosphate kinase
MPTGSGRLGEFELIATLFAPLAGPGAFDLTDDAAVVATPPGHELVATKDMMVAGVHFLADDPPDLVARKLLRVNLSDLAAMGAAPHGYLLGVSLPAAIDDAWLARFAAGLAADQAEFGIVLLGGDTTSTPGPLTLSLTALGFVETGRALRRAGARPGDRLLVTGCIGDAALGLLALRGELADPDGVLAGRYRLPVPRVAFGRRLPGLASAGLDVSDGLVADVGHLCEVSGVAATLRAGDVPLSAAARAALAVRPALLETVLTGGDDYELVFAAPPGALPALRAAAAETGVPLAEIGVVRGGAGVTVEDARGAPVALSRRGFRHR